MTIKTLKKLIEMEAEKLDFNFNTKKIATLRELKEAYHKATIFKDGVIKLLDMFEEENSVPVAPSQIQPFGQPYVYPSGATLEGIPDEVPYGYICPCNPANGGSGICGCIMGNRMVKNPKKYGAVISNFDLKGGTTTAAGYPPETTITNTINPENINPEN